MKTKKQDNTNYQVKEIKYYDVICLKLLAENFVLNRTRDTDGNKVQRIKTKRYVKGEK